MGMDHAYKHYCKICKKGFGCGQALGGHMRAHGINDDRATTDDFDEDPSASGEWEEKPSPNKRMYGLRANSNRHKCFRVCDNCGEEFFSWKSFLDHGKCSLDNEADDDEIVSCQRSDGGGWSKGKRKAPFVASSEEEDLANCLVMLSSARVDPNPMTVVETESSSASAGKEDDRRLVIDRIPNERWKNSVACGVPRGMFECKACKKVFSSHQALGGHRASHKKVKGCFASRIDALDYPPPMDEVAVEMTMAIVPYDRPPPPKKASKVHECSICHRVFSSGQALGGHKRCHWLTSNSPDGGSVARFNPMTDDLVDHQLTLNLNLPAMANYVAAVRPVPWTDQSEDKRNDKGKAAIDVVDDEAESRVKLAKLSDLKDMKVGGEGSWLQVGIGSSSNEGGGL